MDLKEFVDSEKSLIERFCEYWKQEHEKDPEAFPMTLGEGDWWEQLMIFGEIEGH